MTAKIWFSDHKNIRVCPDRETGVCLSRRCPVGAEIGLPET
jgi:hypothetical protein